MPTTFVQDFTRGLRIGTGILAALGMGWAGISLGAAAWGGLPTVSSGSGLTSTAWNDVVGQINTIAGAMSVNSGNVGIGTNASVLSWPLAISRGSTWDSTAWLSVQGNRTTPGSTFGGIVGYYGTEAIGWIQFITGTASDSGHIYFNTKPPGGANAIRLAIRDTGNVGVGITNPQSAFQVVGNYIQIPNLSGSAPAASDCDQASEAGRMAIYTPNPAAPATSYLYICPQGGGWVVK